MSDVTLNPQSDRAKSILNYLNTVNYMRQQSFQGKLPAGAVYRGVEDFLLNNARFFKKRSFDVKPMRLKRCYNNALSLMLESRGKLFYCEGYASGIIPVMHAWCCDVNGVVYDPTWQNDILRNEEDQYFGCVFDSEFVTTLALLTGAGGVLSDEIDAVADHVLYNTCELHEINSYV